MPSRSLKDCDKKLKEKFPLIKKDFETKFPGWNILITATHRPPEEQFELYKRGRKLNPHSGQWEMHIRREIVTNCDGDKVKSDHNHYPSKAIDVALRRPDKDLEWSANSIQWQTLVALVEAHGLRSGGRWARLKDYPHIYI